MADSELLSAGPNTDMLVQGVWEALSNTQLAQLIQAVGANVGQIEAQALVNNLSDIGQVPEANLAQLQKIFTELAEVVGMNFSGFFNSYGLPYHIDGSDNEAFKRSLKYTGGPVHQYIYPTVQALGSETSEVEITEALKKVTFREILGIVASSANLTGELSSNDRMPLVNTLSTDEIRESLRRVIPADDRYYQKIDTWDIGDDLVSLTHTELNIVMAALSLGHVEWLAAQYYRVMKGRQRDLLKDGVNYWGRDLSFIDPTKRDGIFCSYDEFSMHFYNLMRRRGHNSFDAMVYVAQMLWRDIVAARGY